MSIKIFFILLIINISLQKEENLKGSQSLKVMTFNIHYGNTLEGKYDIEEIGSVIKESKAELICLQEVDSHWASRSLYESTINILSAITGYYYFYVPIYDRESQRGKLYPNEQFGVGFLSKYKIVEAKNYQITRWSTQPEDPQPGEEGFPPKKGGFGHIVIDVNGTYVFVYNTHLDYRANPPEGYDESIRVIQVREMMKIMDISKYPVILTGDMNSDTSSKDVFEPMLEFFNDAWKVANPEDNGYSFPCNEPNIRIDYILTSKKNIRVDKAELIHTYVSDHLPVIVDISFDAK